MAHFARIDENNIVQEIHVINNSVLDADGEFPESEASGQEFQASLGIEGLWLQCSYNGNFRGVYPGRGWTYDEGLDEFVAPPPPPEPEVLEPEIVEPEVVEPVSEPVTE